MNQFINWFKEKMSIPSTKTKHDIVISSKVPIIEVPSIEDRIDMMNEVRELRLKSNKTTEELKRQREITALLNFLAVPV